MSRRSLLLTLLVILLLLVGSLFLFPSFRSFLTSRVIPIPPVTETMVGGRLLATPSPGQHTLTYEARTSTGQTITDSVTFTQPNPSTSPTPQCNNNGVLDAGEACDTGPTTLKDYCSNRCQVELDVTEYGATPNMPADPRTFAESDTLNIQNALNSALGLSPSTHPVPPGSAPVKTPPTFTPPDTLVSTVYFPAGTYDITQVHPWWGTTITGDGPSTIFKRLPNRDHFERMFITSKMLANGDSPYLYWDYSGAVDSQPLTIKNVAFDGNRRGQTQGTGYANGLEHQNIIIVHTDAGPGRIKVNVEDVEFDDGAYSAVYLLRNTDVTLNRIKSHNTFKSFSITGGCSTFTANDVLITNSGPTPYNLDPIAIDYEIDGSGACGGRVVNSKLTNWVADGAIEILAEDARSTIEFDNYVMTTTSLPRIVTLASEGAIDIKNSKIIFGQYHSNNYNYILRSGGSVTFTDTEIVASEKGSPEANRDVIGLNILWNFGSGVFRDQSVTCNNCTFTTDESVDPGDTPIAIQTSYDYKSWDNVLTINGGSISSAFKGGLKMLQGGNWNITGMDIQSSNIPSVIPDISVRSSGSVQALPTGEKTWYDVQFHQITPSDVVIWRYEPTDTNNSYVKD